MENIWYEICIQGILDVRWGEVLDHLEIHHENGQTTLLRGPVRDQASLYGLFERLNNLNLTLLSVKRVESSGSTLPVEKGEE